MTTLADRIPAGTARALREKPACDVCGKPDGSRAVTEIAGLLPPADGYRPPHRREGCVRGAWIKRLCGGCARRLSADQDDGMRRPGANRRSDRV